MSSPRTPLVSVVTPVYNGLPHLVECIESVLTQTYQNWEYVIANNCSTDGTLETVLRYARKDARIRVHTNDRLVRMAPNHDIALSLISPRTEYCKIVHADDFLFPECLERMVAVATANPSVGLVGSYRLDDRFVNLDGLPYPSTVVSGREIRRRSLLEGLFVFGSPSSLLIRADLVRGRSVFMDDDTFFMHGDTAACHEMLDTTDFGFVHQVLTFTRRHAAAVDTPRAIALNSYVAAHGMILKRFGRQILSEAEYQACLDASRRQYYSFLGRSVLDRKKPDFWAFHAQALDAIGDPVDYRRLARAAFTENRKGCLLHPIRTLSRLSEAIKGLRNYNENSPPSPSMNPETSSRQLSGSR